MVLLGLLMAAAAVTVAVGVVAANEGTATLTAFGETVPFVNNQWQVFLAGAAVAVLFVVGVTLLFMGVGRGLRKRRDLRYLREEHEESLTTLEMEKRRLQRELARVRGGDPGSPSVPGAPVSSPSGPPVDGRPVAGPAARAAHRTGGPMVGSAASSFFDRTD
ncbi:hypothetical protein Acsp03_47910 [Actinomadura sp. NBRC 104412]|uniref:hypothetical protein n=1 Tax=Actinomadura sp. NBRC 104412 TaxID=3032203 RepID=UPI0024A24332|nr:hypothetical protein [Actinomadura sp. NBRC 104412]GLZ07325.1 hypothetical protein Acsp03_47910 [Actinomadura sp. NBRC 104412]